MQPGANGTPIPDGRVALQPPRPTPYLLLRHPNASTTEPQMNFEILIPITLFLTIAYVIKVIVDSRTRRALIGANGSEELVRSIMAGEDMRQKHSSLRWGVTLVAVAVGFGFIEAGGWNEVTPGVIAVLAGATGLGNLAYYFLTRRMGAIA